MDIQVQTTINIPAHLDRANGEKLWTFAASEWHKLYRPYCPFAEGVLYNAVNITAGKCTAVIEHVVPYAHYIYEGKIFGPNVTITQGGAVVGYFSPVKPKRNTGRMMRFRGKACRHWDEAAVPTQKPLLVQSMQTFINSGALGFNRG